MSRAVFCVKALVLLIVLVAMAWTSPAQAQVGFEQTSTYGEGSWTVLVEKAMVNLTGSPSTDGTRFVNQGSIVLKTGFQYVKGVIEQWPDVRPGQGTANIETGEGVDNLQTLNGFVTFTESAKNWDYRDEAGVDGAVRYTGKGPFVFPTVDRADRAQADCAVTTPYKAGGMVYETAKAGGFADTEYFWADPAKLSGAGAQTLGIDALSDCEFWIVNGTAGASLSFEYDIDSRIERLTGGRIESLRLAGWTGTQWQNTGASLDALSTLEYGSLTYKGKPNDFVAYTFAAMLDRDGDGLTDDEEEELGTDPDNPDTDGDGVDDGTEVGDPDEPRDTDKDCVIDALESDIKDHDGDGYVDALDPDNDGDGLNSCHEDRDGDGDPTNDDTDEDGVPDFQDPDDDGDKIPTSREGADPNGDGNPSDARDSNGDGIPDYLDPGTAPDRDGDGLPDYIEEEVLSTDPDNPDTDGDGVDDGTEVGPDCAEPLDEDEDGVPDVKEPDDEDTDGDGIPDERDPDDDGDGKPTKDEDPNKDGDPTNDDSDEDGVPDYLDPFDEGVIFIEATKKATVRNLVIGETAPFVLTFENLLSIPVVVDLVDFMPPGFNYVEGTAALANPQGADFSLAEPDASALSLTWEDVRIEGSTKVEVVVMLRAGIGLDPGEFVNQTCASVGEGPTQMCVSNVAWAKVEIAPDALFDCSTVIGQVFQDDNRDGYFQDGEGGMPGVRLGSVDGSLIYADDFGRFSVPCAAMPQDRGENYILKLDTATLPFGYKISSENPRVIRLTAGKMSQINFGVYKQCVFEIGLDERAFQPDSLQMHSEWQNYFNVMFETLKSTESLDCQVFLRMTQCEATDAELGWRRLRVMERFMEKNWNKRLGRQLDYELELIRRINVGPGCRSLGGQTIDPFSILLPVSIIDQLPAGSEQVALAELLANRIVVLPGYVVYRTPRGNFVVVASRTEQGQGVVQGEGRVGG